MALVGCLLAAGPARAIDAFGPVLSSDAATLAQGGIDTGDVSRREWLRLERPALLAGAAPRATSWFVREDILRVKAPDPLAGTHADDFSGGLAVAAGATLNGMPVGVGARLDRHRSSLSAVAPPLGPTFDMREDEGGASIAVGLAPLSWLAVGLGATAGPRGPSGEPSVDPLYELRLHEGAGSLAFAHRVDRQLAYLAAPNGVTAPQRTPALGSRLDLVSPSDELRAAFELPVAAVRASCDLSRAGTWQAALRLSPFESRPNLSLRAEREERGLNATAMASVNGTAVGGLLLDGRLARWATGVDVPVGRGLLAARYGEGSLAVGAHESDLGARSAKVLVGADVDLGLWADQRGAVAFRQVSVAYTRPPGAFPVGFSAGAQGLRIRADPGAVRYGSRLLSGLDHEDRLRGVTVDALALTGGATIALGQVELRASAAQLVPLRIRNDGADPAPAGGGGGPASPAPPAWERVRALVDTYGGGNVELLELSVGF